MREVPYGKRASQALVFKSMGQFDTDSQGIGAQSSESPDADDSSKNLIRQRYCRNGLPPK